MSGQQIGSAVGFVAGFFLPGGPQVWATIGGMVGGMIAPTEIEGPHIGDGANQSSQEGIPISWVVGGTFGWIQGNIVQKSERREIRKEDDGKGSGQVQVTYEAHQDYCIMVCESSETRDSTVVGPLIVKMDGKIVYDMRPGKNFGAENAKFLKNHTFYTGGEDQMPDPTMEAIVGVDKALAYRGVFTCVARDINLSQYGERIPVYEWVMVADGANVVDTTTVLQVPNYGRFQNAEWPLADPERLYTYNCFWINSLAEGITSPQFSTIAECNQWFYDTTGIVAPSDYVGYSANSTGTAGSYTEGVDGGGFSITNSRIVTQPDVVDIKSLVLMYQFQAPAEWYDVAPDASCGVAGLEEWMGTNNGMVLRLNEPGTLSVVNCGGDNVMGGYYPYCINVTSKSVPPSGDVSGDPCLLGVPTLLPDVPGYSIDCNGIIAPTIEYHEVTGLNAYRVLQVEETTTVDNVVYYAKRTIGPVLHWSDPNNNEIFWTDKYNAAVLKGEMDAGKVYGTDYPVAVSTTYEGTYDSTYANPQAASVATGIVRICKRGGLLAEEVDTADVDQTLLGYGVTNTYNGADCIRPLLTAYGLYGADYDGQIHFHKLGEDADLVIDPGEMIAGETQTDEAEREQAVEYPRLILLNYIDPEQDYTVRPQPWRRTSPDVRAIGEQTMQVPVVMAPVDAARTVDTYGKRATARAQGTRKFSVPFAGASGVYLKLHPGKAFGLDSKRWVPDKVTIEDGEIAIEASFDRQSAYTSNVTAVPALPPTPPPSSIGGVTLFAAMNLPRLRSKDNSPGMYIAVAGLLDNWPGCLLQMSIDDGTSWTTAFSSMVTPSVMGYLTAPLAVGGETLSVSVHGGDLNSITSTQFANGGNPCAIVTAGNAEIVQFMTADEVAPGSYDLTDLGRARLSTIEAAHVQGDRFVKLTDFYFLPLDISLAGRTIKFRPVTFGTVPENNASYDVVFQPKFTGAEVIENYTDDTGEPYTDDAGNPYYQVT